MRTPYISNQLRNHQVQDMKCKIMYCFTFTTYQFFSLAYSFCSIEKLLQQMQLWAENDEVSCKEQVDYILDMSLFRILF